MCRLLHLASYRIHIFAIVLLALLSGCAALGDLISGSAVQRDPAIAYPEQLKDVQIGVTTKEDVRNLLGEPTDLQISSDDGSARESWAYAQTPSKINPLQYIPGLGFLALPKDGLRHSFAISFSPEGTVEGIALREVQPSDASQASKGLPKDQNSPLSYGNNNPLAHYSKQGDFVGSGILEE